MLGDIYRMKDNIGQAIAHYSQAITINENYYQAFYSLGTLYLYESKFKEAREAFNSAILIEPTYSKAYGALGTVEQELGNIDSAIQNYSKAVEYDMMAYDIYYRLSSAYNISKQYDNAKISAKESLNIKRNYAPAYFELGMAEKLLGNKVAAKDAFERAKKDRNWRKPAQFEIDLINKGL
jgi:tetratricopeptide (TPR) repeat protein